MSSSSRILPIKEPPKTNTKKVLSCFTSAPMNQSKSILDKSLSQHLRYSGTTLLSAQEDMKALADLLCLVSPLVCSVRLMSTFGMNFTLKTSF